MRRSWLLLSCCLFAGITELAESSPSARASPKGPARTPGYTGRPGSLTTPLLLRLNSNLARLTSDPAAAPEGLKLGADFEGFAHEAATAFQGIPEIEGDPRLRKALQRLQGRLRRLPSEGMPYLETNRVATSISALIGFAQDGGAVSASGVEHALHSEAEEVTELIFRLHERFTALLLPVLGHFGYRDFVRSWNSGVFQYGLYAPDASRYGNDVHAGRFRRHDWRHVDDFLSVFSDHLSPSRRPLPPAKRLDVYRRNIETAARISDSIERRPELGGLPYRYLFQVGHESNLQLWQLPAAASPSASELAYFAGVGGRRVRLDARALKSWRSWWSSVPGMF